MKRIFISYRRSISKHTAHLVYLYLKKYYAKNQVFFDLDNLKPGDDFPEKIRAALRTCEVFLAVIDKDWHLVADQNGLRLDDDSDWVRQEIQTVLDRNRLVEGMTPPVKILPIVIDEAKMPDASEMPEPLGAFCNSTAVFCRSDQKSLEAGIKELENLIDGHLGSPTTGEFGFAVLTRKANVRSASSFRYRAVAKLQDLEPFISLSDNEPDIAGANPEASGGTRWELYQRWCEQTAENPSLSWDHPDNKVKSFLTLEHKCPDDTWVPIGVSIMLPLTQSGGVKLMCTGAPADDNHAKKVNALSLDWDDLERGGGPCILMDTWIIARRQQTPSKRWARYVHERWGTCLILRHLAELWSELDPERPRTILVEPDNPVIHKMLWELGFERRNRNAASGDIYYLQFPPNPYLYHEEDFIARFRKVIDNTEWCGREFKILREPAAT